MPEGRRAKRWADAWQCLANVVGPVDELPLTVAALRERFDESREALGPFSTSPSRDPLGRYLWSLAGHQADRSLEAFWWSMCDLGDDVPFYHASYAVGGVAGLPPPPGKEGSGFREDVVHAALRLGQALERLVVRRRRLPKQAEVEYGAAVGWALAAFPFPDRWCDVLLPELPRQPESVRKRLASLVPGLTDLAKWRKRPKRPGTVNWRERNDHAVQRLKRNPEAARNEVEKLLAEERAHAKATGDSIPLNRALCRFSSTIATADADRAVAWAEEAMAWEPWDAYSWTTLTRALQRAGRLDDALVASWQAVERFPQDVVARTGLGEVLKAAGRLEEAEAVYQETVDRFPQDLVTRNGLGEVLKAAGRLEEAETVYRETVERFPQDVVTRTGLGEVLKATGRLEEAETVYRETVERFPQDAVARAGLGEVLKAAGRLEEAEAVYRETVERFPRNVYAKRGFESMLRLQGKPVPHLEAEPSTETNPDAPLPAASEQADGAREKAHVVYTQELPSGVSEVREGTSVRGSRRDLRTRTARLFRRAARRAEMSPALAAPSPGAARERAEELLDAVLAERPHDARALTEKGLLLLDAGATEAARTLLAEHAGRLPAAPLLWASLARAVREEARATGRRLDDQAREEVLRAPKHLHALDHAYEPLVRLQEGRAYLALTDGNQRLEGGARAFERLRRWIVQNRANGKTREFEPWYGSEVQRYALASIDVEDEIEASHVDAIATCVEENARFVDVLEEDFALRLT